MDSLKPNTIVFLLTVSIPVLEWGVCKVVDIPENTFINQEIGNINCYIFSDPSIAILIHILEHFLKGSFFSHKLSKWQTAIKVSVHLVKEFLNLFPVIRMNFVTHMFQMIGLKPVAIKSIPKYVTYIEVWHPEALRTLYHSISVNFPSPSRSALSNIFLICNKAGVKVIIHQVLMVTRVKC